MVKTVSSLVVVVQPVAGRSSGPLSVQPSIMAVDTAVRQTLPDFFKNTETAVFRQLLENCTWYRTGRASLCVCFQGECVSVGVTTLTISAVLKDANGNPAEGLQGNTTIPFSGCWANYTDLAIFTSGGSPLLHKIFLGGCCQLLFWVFTVIFLLVSLSQVRTWSWPLHWMNGRLSPDLSHSEQLQHRLLWSSPQRMMISPASLTPVQLSCHSLLICSCCWVVYSFCSWDPK